MMISPGKIQISITAHNTRASSKIKLFSSRTTRKGGGDRPLVPNPILPA
jgi:hypothetical protein